MRKPTCETEFIKRFERAMELRDKRPVDVAKACNISEATISQYRKGYSEPKKERLSQIAKYLHVDPAWLMGIDVPMEKKFPDADKLADITLNPVMVDYAWKLLNLEDAKKNVVLELIDHLSGKE